MAEKRFLLVYGSQTGQAQAISEEIRDRAVERGFQPDIHCLSQSEKKFNLEKEPVFVVVVSTTGDGDAPDTANKFWRRLKKRTLLADHLANCKYALLGLGDTNYSNFCNMGKMLDKRLRELGASQFYPPGFADDAVGLEIVVEPWIDGLWDSLKSALSVSGSVENKELSPHSGATDTLQQKVQSQHIVTSEKQGQLTVNDSVIKRTSTEERIVNNLAESVQDRLTISSTSTNKTQTTESPDSSVAQTSATSRTLVPSEKLRTVNSDSSIQVNNMVTVTSSRDSYNSKDTAIQSTKPQNEEVQGSSQAVKNSTQSGEMILASSIEVTPVTSPSDGSGGNGDGGSKRRGSFKEDATSWREELRTLSMELASTPLTLPTVPPLFVKVLIKTACADVTDGFPFDKVQYVVKSSVSMAALARSRLLTREGSVKKTIELEFNIQDCPRLHDYRPGDAFGFVCPNSAAEVDWLLQRLNLGSDREKLMTLSILPDTAKRNPILPKHIPIPCSIAQYFGYCADIRCIPKKVLLCYLSTCCSSWVEKRRLEELASRQGASDYTRLFLEQRNDFLDVLSAFPSCQPLLPRLIELLPKLQPRHYSASSSPLVDPSLLRIAFNVEELPLRPWLKVERSGLATGWFHSVAVPQLNSGQTVKVPIFPRVLNPFHFPDDPSTPIVMIGPGTGVSPFIGFLEHRQHQCQEDRVGESEMCRVGKAWLFFGCRHPDKDYLYKTKLESFLSSGVLTHLHVSFSRHRSDIDGEQQPSYVQDNMRVHWEELARWIMEDNASVFVCGDAKNMAKDINGALVEVLSRHLQAKPGLSPETAEDVLQRLKENGRYLVDAWG